jgi:hypothetical protein
VWHQGMLVFSRLRVTNVNICVRGHLKYRDTNKSFSGRYNSISRSKSPGKYVRKCWKYGKDVHYKKYCRSKKVDKAKIYDDSSSKKEKTSTKEGGYVYLESTGTHADHDVWLIESGA